MASRQAPKRWRDRPFAHWMRLATKQRLHNVIGMYSNSSSSTDGLKTDLLVEAMDVLDAYRPPLSHQHAGAAIYFELPPPIIAQSQPSEAPAAAGPSSSSIRSSDQTPEAIGLTTSRGQLLEGRPTQESDQPLKDSGKDSEALTLSSKPTDGQIVDFNAHTNSRGSVVVGKAKEDDHALSAIDEAEFQAATSSNSVTDQIQLARSPQVPADVAPAKPATQRAAQQTSVAGPSGFSESSFVKSTGDDVVITSIRKRNFSTSDHVLALPQAHLSTKSIAENLTRAARQHLLQVTHDCLQPLEGRRHLLPIQNSASNQMIVDDAAFAYIFDDTHDQKIHSIQVQFLSNQIPDTHSYQCSKAGAFLPYRGRGPVWADNSCHVDCCIVAARLMSVGQTRADLSDPGEFTEFQTHFQNILAFPWELSTRETNVKQRHQFLAKYYERRQLLEKSGNFGSMQAANDSWSVCSEGFRQFEYAMFKETKCDICLKISNTTQAKTAAAVEFGAPTSEYWDSMNRPDVTKLFETHFAPQPFRVAKACTQQDCSGQRRRTSIIQGELPQRMVVNTPSVPSADREYDRDIVGATSNIITIEYTTDAGPATAQYRWLGGIYHYRQHYRLYWSDRQSGEGESLMVYDGMRLSGSIIGGVPALDPNNAVPRPWSRGCDVLFYERIYPEKAQANAEQLRIKVDSILYQAQLSGTKRQHSEEPEVSGESSKRVKGSLSGTRESPLGRSPRRQKTPSE